MPRKILVLSIFLGSFVSFALEPMVGRALLPVFGGAPSVWVVCLAAFQILMVGGYFYAGRVSRGERTSLALLLHVALLLAAGGWCIFLSNGEDKILQVTSELTSVGPLDVLVSVLVLVGVAFVLLSANATLVQNLSGGDYRLYAVSNLGSFLGLFAYPLLVEPFVGLSAQWIMLGFSIGIYAFLVFLSSRAAPTLATFDTKVSESEDRPFRGWLYLVIPAITCALLNAVTTHLTMDIAPLPLLWAVLLGIFLLSYVIGFSGKSKPMIWCVLTVLATSYSIKEIGGAKTNNIAFQLGPSISLLLFSTTFLHSWLYEIRPPKQWLGRYYLLNVIGGALGGSAVSMVAPLVFPAVWEYPILIALVAVSVLVFLFQRRLCNFAWGAASVLAIVAALSFTLQDGGPGKSRKTIYRARGFLGTMRVDEVKAGSSDGQGISIHEFVHGETVHGVQVMRKEMERMPTCYFTPRGCGFSVAAHHKYREGKPMRVCVVGLGIGVMFAYGRPDDTYRAYEISPEVLAAAQNPSLFTFVPHCLARTELMLGDARKGLEAELANGAEKYDVMLIDAFTGDNLPYHLSTKEALELYLKLLNEDGVLCINFTNKHLDLRPYVKRIGEELGLAFLVINSEKDLAHLGFATNMAIFTRHPEKLSPPPVNDDYCEVDNLTDVKVMPALPTDDKGSFLPLIRLTIGDYTN